MARISTAEHAALGWRMGELAADFELLDAWALPAIGTAEEFPDLVAIWDRVGDPEARSKSSATDKLFAVRTKLGEWFGWDDNLNELPIPGCTEISLRDRLPDDLKPLDHSPGVGLFLPVFSTDREWVGELSNGTVHAAAHLGWVLREDGSFEGRLAVHAKTRGRFGGIYMKLIAPFRHFIVYPALVKSVGREWEKRAT